jgi:glutathione S-transferase
MTPKLYTHFESGNSYKPRLLASLLNIRIEEVAVDMFKLQHKSTEYLAINPRGTVPALMDGDNVFTDSAAMLVYLAGTHPDPGSNKTPSSYWSTDPVEQAGITDWLAFATYWVHLGVSRARKLLYFDFAGVSTDKEITTAKAMGVQSLEILNDKLEKENWLVLGRPTIADIAIFPYVALAPSKLSGFLVSKLTSLSALQNVSVCIIKCQMSPSAAVLLMLTGTFPQWEILN